MKRIYAREDGSLTYEERLSCLGYTYGRDVVTNATRAAEHKDNLVMSICTGWKADGYSRASRNIFMAFWATRY